MSKRCVWLILTIIGFMFVFADFSVLFAQETDDEDFTLEEITVTAQKREENVQKTSVAISVITADEIENKSMKRPPFPMNWEARIVFSTTGYRSTAICS